MLTGCRGRCEQYLAIWDKVQYIKRGDFDIFQYITGWMLAWSFDIYAISL
ncbi:hypothetical protein OKW28_002637 [Paraburkholderia sp. 40]